MPFGSGRTMISWYLISRRKFCLISCQAVLKGSMCQIKENAVHSMISLTLVGMRQGTFHPLSVLDQVFGS